MFPVLFFCSTANVTFSVSVNFWMQMFWTHWRVLKQTSSSCQSLSGSCAAVLQHVTSPVILNCKKSAGRLTCYEMSVWADSSWRSTWEWMWGETQLLSACKIITTWHSSFAFPWQVYLTNVPIAVHCTRSQINDCTTFMTALFGKHTYFNIAWSLWMHSYDLCTWRCNVPNDADCPHMTDLMCLSSIRKLLECNKKSELNKATNIGHTFESCHIYRLLMGNKQITNICASISFP